MFARKILRAKTTDSLDWTLEKAALRAISKTGHKNIIELLFVYKWRDQYNFVFPFVEHNLHDVLHGVWQPETIYHAPLEEHWLWKQIIDVASGLEAIHNPEKGNSSIIGFHFDLKPSNILVTNGGVLKITDFGQALIKFVQKDDQTYGIHRGGSPVYQAPEACPTRSSMVSGHVDDKIHRKYDVWSLACIMLEVLIFVLDHGKEGVELFEKRRRREPVEGAFYSMIEVAQLKPCVQEKLRQYERVNLSRETDFDYRSNVVGLLRKMFDTNQTNRPSSKAVHDRLSKIAGGIYQSHASEEQISGWTKQVLIRQGDIELGWRGSSGVQSFLEM